MPTRFEYPDGQNNQEDFLVWAILVASCVLIIYGLINVVDWLRAMLDAWKSL